MSKPRYKSYAGDEEVKVGDIVRPWNDKYLMRVDRFLDHEIGKVEGRRAGAIECTIIDEGRDKGLKVYTNARGVELVTPRHRRTKHRY
jgi:hypothetical protein